MLVLIGLLSQSIHMQAFQSFFRYRFFVSFFLLAKLATSSIRVNTQLSCVLYHNHPDITTIVKGLYPKLQRTRFRKDDFLSSCINAFSILLEFELGYLLSPLREELFAILQGLHTRMLDVVLITFI